MIDPGSCPIAVGNYGVIPGKTGNILQTCGPNQNESCVFDAISLENAVKQCDEMSDICSRFTYVSTDNLMQIIDPTSVITEAANGDLYLRQVAIRKDS